MAVAEQKTSAPTVVLVLASVESRKPGWPALSAGQQLNSAEPTEWCKWALLLPRSTWCPLLTHMFGVALLWSAGRQAILSEALSLWMMPKERGGGYLRSLGDVETREGCSKGAGDVFVAG